MADRNYINIPDTVFSDLHLSGNDAIIYSLVSSLCKWNKTGCYECNIIDIAERINLSEHGTRKSIDKLVSMGLLEKERKQKTIILQVTSSSAQSDEQERHKVTDSSAQSDAQFVTKCRTDSHKVTNLHYIKNKRENKKENKRENKKENAAFCENSEPIFEQKTTPDSPSIYDIFVTKFADHWMATHEYMYQPTNATFSTAVRNLVDNFRSVMQTDGYVLDQPTVEMYVTQWLELSWSVADTFDREHWSPEYLARKFNFFQNKITSNGTTQETSSQRGGNISDEYIRAQFDKLR